MVLPPYSASPASIAALPWSTPEVPDDAVRSLAGEAGIPLLIARLLWLRGIRSPLAATSFLNPRLADLQAPQALPDMAVGAARVAQAIRTGERIAVCGDYDVDGMTGTALLVRFLRLAGADAIYAIPDRSSDGYGLSVAGVDRLHAQGVRLAVTVDNGVSALEAIARANALGIDVVVTDHHLPGPTLPAAVAVIDPQRTDRPGTPPSLLCGCGLAFKLAWGVADALQRGRNRMDERLKSFLRDAVGLVALATVADVVPLVGENRILVSTGLAALRASQHAGVKALLEVAGLGTAPLSTEDLVWRLSPRLNAAGRLNRPDLAIDLFATPFGAEDAPRARALAAELDRANEERKTIEKGVVVQALEQARARRGGAGRGARAPLGDDRRSLVVVGENWHRGVIGIVAARLVDAHRRPTVVIGLEGDGGRGSCRTTRSINLYEALHRCRAHLKRYGGHAAAAGLEVDRDALPAFEEAFEEAVRDQTSRLPADFLADGECFRLDGEATAGDFTLETVEHVRRLAPFGEGNPEPRFGIRGALVAGRPKLMGSGSDHLAFTLRTPTGAIRVIAFRQSRHFELVASGAPLDLVATPVVNEWRGTRTPELMAHDVRPARRT